METRVSKLLGTKYPVIQGGMAWVAEYHLAAAVSNAGGLGIIGAASAPPEVVREQVREVKKLTAVSLSQFNIEKGQYYERTDI